jgi:glutaminyl-tRNA synthetase
LAINSNAFADDGIKNAKALDKFQFERVGYFSVDPDTTNEKVKINYQLFTTFILFDILVCT